MRIHPQVLQIGTDWGEGGHTKLYLVEGERKALIDTGVSTSPRADIGPYLAYFGYSLADIDLILNTHGHDDHAGGNVEVQRASDAGVCLHQADVYLVEDPGRYFDTYRAPVLRLMGREEDLEQARAQFVAKVGGPQKVARGLEDGEVIDLGGGVALRVVGLPGHTLGSVGYYWEREGLLLCGDSAVGQGSQPGIIPVLNHPLAYQDTLRRLRQLPLRLLGLGHYYQGLTVSSKPVKQGAEIEFYLSDCEEVNNLLMEAMGWAMHRRWGQPFPRIMAEAVDQLTGRLWLRREPTTGLPRGAAYTLGNYYRELQRLGV